MFLIGAIKPIAEKKFKICFIFYATVKGRVDGIVRNKTSFISLRCWFGGGSKNFIQKKGESIMLLFIQNNPLKLSKTLQKIILTRTC